MRLVQITILLGVLFFTVSLSTAESFPYRKDFPEVSVVGMADLKKGVDDGTWLLVDVRSDIEFSTIHPKGAFHVSLSDPNFADKLRMIVERFPGKKIALYCNGVTCIKSYLGALKAQNAGISNASAYDEGVLAWARAYPADTLLMGKQVDDAGNRIIPDAEFRKHLLDYPSFRNHVRDAADAVVIDARDQIQSISKLPGFESAMPIPIDKLIRNVIARGNMKNKQLFIFDQVGRQVYWLMYYLADKGYRDYYFLAGGATAVLDEQEYR